jgi:hypothetical protein
VADCHTCDWKVFYRSGGVDTPEGVFWNLHVANKVMFNARLRHASILPLIPVSRQLGSAGLGQFELTAINLALLAIHVQLLPGVLNV